MFGPDQTDEVDPQKAAELQRGGAVLLDVREIHEWDSGHAPGATHVPLGELMEAIPRFAGQEVLAICRSGARSARAASALVAAGVAAHNVAGGMLEWEDVDLPVVRDDGSPGRVA